MNGIDQTHILNGHKFRLIYERREIKINFRRINCVPEQYTIEIYCVQYSTHYSQVESNQYILFSVCSCGIRTFP